MRRLRARVMAVMTIATSIVVACKYSPGAGPNDSGSGDAPPILPDAGPCEELSTACFSDGTGGTVLQTCAVVGQEPEITPCTWDCVEGSPAHCGQLQPSGGAVRPADLLKQPNQVLADIDLVIEGVVVDTETGEIAGVRGQGQGLVDGIEFIIRNNVGIFRVNKLTITDEVNIRGLNGVAFVALDSIAVNEEIDLRDCGVATRAQGGFLGGAPEAAGGGPEAGNGGAAGIGANDDSSGGGGGAYAGSGGGGGSGQNEDATNGGAVFGDETISILRGGGGGGGGGNNGGRGGHGGGAIQLVANGAITFSSAGRINAGGCGGQSGQDQRAAGGGGAGGAILIEGSTVMTAGSAVLAVNGGGGGGGDRPSEGAENGEDAKFSLSRAAGGSPGGQGGSGGDGAADVTLIGDLGLKGRNGGGGGGGVGWIRINTKGGTNATIDPATIVSPTLATGSPASLGTAVVQ